MHQSMTSESPNGEKVEYIWKLRKGYRKYFLQIIKNRLQDCQHVQQQVIKMFLYYSGCSNIPFWERNDSEQDVKDTSPEGKIFHKSLAQI